MDIKQIEERIEKKKAKIAKIEKRIDKWEKAISDAGFKKEYSWNCQEGFYWNREAQKYDIPFEQFKADRFEEYAANCRNEIRYAKSDLEEANLQLVKYNNQLKIEQAKQDKLSADRIKVIVEFLENWKSRVTEYTRENAKNMKLYFEFDSKACDYHNNRYLYINNGLTEEEVKAKAAEARKMAKSYYSMTDSLTREVYQKFSETLVNEEALKNILDKEADNLYLDLIERITKITGEIKDASYLQISPKGNIDGYIIGENGNASVETIGAGGYNIQCYHFRTLVKPKAN